MTRWRDHIHGRGVARPGRDRGDGCRGRVHLYRTWSKPDLLGQDTRRRGGRQVRNMGGHGPHPREQSDNTPSTAALVGIVCVHVRVGRVHGEVGPLTVNCCIFATNPPIKSFLTNGIKHGVCRAMEQIVFVNIETIILYNHLRPLHCVVFPKNWILDSEYLYDVCRWKLHGIVEFEGNVHILL